MATRILLVDVQGGSLAARAASLTPEREVVVSYNLAEAIALLNQLPPFAEVLCTCGSSDGDGIAFLAQALERAPKTTRILLVPHDHLDVVFEALNRDHIFAFLPDDCAP